MSPAGEEFDGPAIAGALKDTPIVRKIHFFPEIDSTSSRATQWLSESSRPESWDKTLILADYQGQGRGRMRRTWLSPPGKNLLFSLILAPGTSLRDHTPQTGDPALTKLALAAPLAVRDAIDKSVGSGHQVTIKYPNDILLNGAKCSGILIERGRKETGSEWFVVGIGVNVNAAPPGEECLYPVTSLSSVTRNDLPRLPILESILDSLHHYLDLPVASLADRFRASCTTLGTSVTITTSGGAVSGTAIDISRDGGLILSEESGIRKTIYSGDILPPSP